MKERNIAVSLILCFLTCGIYSIIWFVSLTDEIGRASEDNSFSGGQALLLVIFTCGIYRIFWSYKAGKLISDAKMKRGLNTSDNSALYLVLSIL